MNGLATHTHKIFDAISNLECIEPYMLVGGTALSLQIGTRLSEDPEFMKWSTGKLQPVYSVTAAEIEEYIKTCLSR